MRRMRGAWWFAAVRPQGKPEGTWALPKGLIGAGESPAETALREGYEETGVTARLGPKLGDVRYVYTWQGERVFKIVSFYLAHVAGGRIGDLPPGMDVEVAEARWLQLDEAPRLLAYKGEREMAERAREALGGRPSIVAQPPCRATPSTSTTPRSGTSFARAGRPRRSASGTSPRSTRRG